MGKKKGNSYIIDEENKIAKIELPRRDGNTQWTIIDLEDLEKVLDYPYTWYSKYDPKLEQYYCSASTYRTQDTNEVKKTTIKLHKFVMDAKFEEVVDHINHDTLDNRKSNLRIIPYKNNSTNRKSRNSNNKSGYRNVSLDTKNDTWIVQIQINKKNTVVGRFPKDQLEEAGRYAEEMRNKYYGEFKGAS